MDIKNPDFRVSIATENDAIHASKSDLPKIFKISFAPIQDIVANNVDTIGSSSSTSNVSSGGVDSNVIMQHALLMAECADVSFKNIDNKFFF